MQIAVAMIKCHEPNNTDILYVKVHEVTECQEYGANCTAGEIIDILKLVV